MGWLVLVVVVFVILWLIVHSDEARLEHGQPAVFFKMLGEPDQNHYHLQAPEEVLAAQLQAGDRLLYKEPPTPTGPFPSQIPERLYLVQSVERVMAMLRLEVNVFGTAPSSFPCAIAKDDAWVILYSKPRQVAVDEVFVMANQTIRRARSYIPPQWPPPEQ